MPAKPLAALVLGIPLMMSMGCGRVRDGDSAHGNGSGERHESDHHAAHKIVVTAPIAKDTTLTEPYVCQIHSRRHIDVRALEGGYLREVDVKEGQLVEEGELMFDILPTIYQAKLAADVAEAKLAKIELQNTQKLFEQNVVSQQEVALAEARLAKVQAQVELAAAEVDFARIKAPFSGIVDRLHEQKGSLIEEGDMLTTLSDNSTMWVYFNVSEARYLEYQEMLSEGGGGEDLSVELVLAGGKVFPQSGVISTVEADFNNETGNIAFRADFPNPRGLLRHGQTGTLLVKRVVVGAIVIPQRATFDVLAKRYVYVVDPEGVARQREIIVQNEKDDIYLIASGLGVDDKIVLEGARQIRDGQTVVYEFREPGDVLSNLKYHAE